MPPSMSALSGRLLAALASLILSGPSIAEESPAAGLPLEEQVQVCGACHGPDGNASQPGTPSLAGQPALAITNQLIYFRERLRQSEVMTPMARGLSDGEIQALAAYYEDQVLEAPDEDADAELMSQGQDLAKQHRCSSCHRSDFSGHEQMPRLANQREDYLTHAMQAYRERSRGGPDTTMIEVMRDISDDEIQALAHYLAHWEK
ncbi:c-type cytochrome [Halomonas huangheensis]|uniref:Cytochrome c domain-containing protein n=1 Tax=Halomonas huangheensis TaxID=1178482 RepID=W1N5E8_9GAMM|nr:c-type cytochrome [Halomonas huangheensis]ALM51670.1 hypothetical protein AR456_04755 [Halomonas huangheensis]ERL50160.1 hypothetical protein BJB45_03270 [Halomonas huangheensis]